MTKKHRISFLIIFIVSILCLLAPFVLTGCGAGGGGTGGGASSTGRNSDTDYSTSSDGSASPVPNSSSDDSASPVPNPESELNNKGVLITISTKDSSMYAVIVGASGHEGGDKELMYAAEDAIDFKNALVNGKTENLAEVKIQNSVSKSTIQEAVNEAKNNISNDGLFIFFYSGYGSNAGGAGFLAPCGAAENPGDFISEHELKSWFENFPVNSKKCVFIDSCFNGSSKTFRNFKYTPPEVLPMESKFIKIKESDNFYTTEKFAGTLLHIPNIYILAAAKDTEDCWESDILENGVFSYYVCEALGGDAETLGSADTEFGDPHPSSDPTNFPFDSIIITAKALSRYVAGEADNYVTGVAKNASGQHPQSYDNCTEKLKIKSVSAYVSNGGSDIIITVSKKDRSACAVIVGVRGDGPTESRFAYNDAVDFKKALLETPFWEDSVESTLECIKATKNRIQTAVSRARKKTAPDGLFIFAYSGFGANSGNSGFLLPFGSLENPRERIKEKELKTWLDSFLCSKKYVLIDSSFNCFIEDLKPEHLKTNFSALKNPNPRYKNDKFAETLAESLNTYVLASSSGEEGSFRDARLQNSVFMYYVCEGLGEKGDIMGPGDFDSNNIITPEELSSYTMMCVSKHVSRMTCGIFTQQPKSYDKNYYKNFSIKNGVSEAAAGNIIITISTPDHSAYAVLAGMSDYYYDSIVDLPFPVKEQICFKTQLTDEAALMGSTSLWKNANVEIKNIRVTKAEIQKAVANARNNIADGGLFIFSYSGHGGTESITTYYSRAISSENISSEELKLWLDIFPSQVKKCVILSTCHAGSFIDKNMKSGDSGVEPIFIKGFIPKFDTEMFAKSLVGLPNTYVMAACRGDEYAWGTWDLDSGAFPYFINCGLCAPVGRSQADLNKDGAVTAEELSAYVAPRVGEYIYNQNIVYEGKRQTCNPQSYDNVPGDLRIK